MGMLDDIKSKNKQKAAEKWMQMGDSAKTTEKQVEYYTKSLDIDPYNAEAWFKKGKSLEKLGRFEDARKCFDLAIEVDPDYQGLIGGFYKPSADVPATPLVEEEMYEVETPEFTPEPISEPVIEDEMMTEEFISEPGIVEDEASNEGVSSYRPPVGDESIFSNVISGDDDDNGSPSLGEPEENVFRSSYDSPKDTEHEVISGSTSVDDADGSSVFSAPEPSVAPFQTVAEEETEPLEESRDTFSSPVVPAPEEPSPSNMPDENVIRGPEPVRSEPDTISSAPVNEPASTRVVSSAPRVSESPKKQAAGYDNSSTLAGSKPAAFSGADIVDVRIPLNEAIKFWAIGIVAMLFVLILSKIL